MTAENHRFVVLLIQCSVSCGYGIQSRAVSCMGPSKPEPLSPVLCMHMPKPITIQGCNTGSCRDVLPTAAVQTEVKANVTEEGPLLSPTLSHMDTPQHGTGYLPPSPTEAITIPQATTTTVPTPKPS